MTTSPTCQHCADWSHGYTVGYEHGKKAGFTEGRITGSTEGPAHPAIVESVNRMFPDWDGYNAAMNRSVLRFREWHRSARQEVTPGESRAA